MYRARSLNTHLRAVTALVALTTAWTNATTAGAKATDSIWSNKPVGEALDQAAKENKPALLYWGATWCPPCNQLKSQVFSHPEFAKATAPFVRIMLDGDIPGAQEWADRLNVSGYPTVLVLAPEKPHGKSAKKNVRMKERLRLVEFVDFTEFKSLVQTALAESLPLKQDLIRKGLQKKATQDEWQLIGFTWNEAETSASTTDADIKKTLRQLKQLFENCPDRRVKSILAARILNLDRDLENKYLNAITEDQSTLMAARGPFIAGAMMWQEHVPGPTAKAIGGKILAAAATLSESHEISAAERIQAQMLTLDVTSQLVAKSLLPEAKLTAAKAAAIKLARKLEQQSKSPFERHAVVTDAAMLMFMAGKPDEAKKLLTDETKKTDTPWYYESSLAAIAFRQRDFPAALKWSTQARNSARGNATKVQWLVTDILMQSRVLSEIRDANNSMTASMADKQEEIFRSSVLEWLKLASALPDGFSGRNSLRAKKVRGAIASWANDQERQRLLTKWAETCTLLKRDRKNSAAKSCRTHLK